MFHKNGVMKNNLFAAVGEKMYFSRKAQDDTKAKIYQMKMEQDILMETDIEIPEEMSVSAMASDGYGKLYIFLRGDNISMIKIVDADDNEVNEVDVTEALGTEISMCQSLAVDSYGNFYITGLWATIGISAEGEKLWLVKNSDIGLGDTFTSIVGWDDMLYIPYDKENNMWIGKINTQDGSIIKEYLLDDMSYEDKILAMGLGNEEEILLYSSVSGVWKWAENNSLLEEIKEISEKNLAYNENIIIRSFLPDGRLLIVKNVDENKRIYQYIPLF